MNNAGRRIQAPDTVRYGGTLFKKNSDNFQIPQTKRKHYCTIKAMNRH